MNVLYLVAGRDVKGSKFRTRKFRKFKYRALKELGSNLIQF